MLGIVLIRSIVCERTTIVQIKGMIDRADEPARLGLGPTPVFPACVGVSSQGWERACVCGEGE